MAVVFVSIALTVFVLLGCAHWYLWRRLVRDVSARGSVWRRTGTVLAFALPVLVIVNVAVGRSETPFTLQRVLAWPGYFWMALLLYLLMALAVGEAVRPLLRRVLERRDAAGATATATATGMEGGGGPVAVPAGESAAGTGAVADGEGTGPGTEPGAAASTAAESHTGGTEDSRVTSRRLFVARTVAAGAAVAAAGTVGGGAYNLLNGPTLKRVTVPLAKLPRSAHGYRIAVVSDIHLGAVLGRSHTERIVETINSAQPDLVAIVGDLVDGTVEDLGPAAEPLRRLRSRHGSFFVTGNHEYFGDAAEWVGYLPELDVHPLQNARVELPGFDLAGVNDVRGEDSGEGPDFGKALGDRDPARASVLLAHQPVQIHESVRHGVDLQLSGHTHGGQIFPFHAVVALANPTVAGLDRFGDTQLYVTRGAGAWGPPVRVGADPDVTVVRLASKQA
ncbi:metallophosphoesterase [Streptomyces marispadix]|uniref:Metallophosphoesterase n=1 Tax=Streptomyces marispadix TaxID=2922868 RepID=A0ABS9T0W0_9ACTN|nr:metallophosphoesterase [Streptomyces marispadix]MCH6162176.1 metallophosphoesterase [Streptomyces marispadix]